MWAPVSCGLLLGTVGQATDGSAGLAIAFGVMLLLVLGSVMARHLSQRSAR